jgi:mono/diheme cytochrome c family protein
MNRLFSLCLLLTVLAISPHIMAQTWFSRDQVEQGRGLFRQHCSACHGHNAEATPHWKTRDQLGRYPPPPLNGSAHAWHHSLDTLRMSIREGGAKLGGWMPPFEAVLNAQQIDSIIAFFQSLWPADTYANWARQYDVKPASPVNLEYLRKRLGAVSIDTPRPTRRDGIYEIRFDDKLLYITEDGEFAFIGDMIDLKSGINLSKQRLP